MYELKNKIQSNINSLIHININGLKNKSSNLETVLYNFSSCKYLCLTEHHLLNSDYNSFCLNNFKIASIYCRDSSWGGSLILIRETDFVRRPDIECLSQTGHIECAAIDTKIKTELTCIVCIYRPPSGELSVFFSTLQKIFLLAKKQKKKINTLRGL